MCSDKSVLKVMQLIIRKYVAIVNCDQACKNQPCEHIKIAYFFQLCSVITYNLFA